MTTVHIDAGRQAATPVSPNIFGNFIEHLGGVVYQALWAQALLNPNLEQIETQDVNPQEWTLYGAAEWQPQGFRSPRCVRLANGARIAGYRSASLFPRSGSRAMKSLCMPAHWEEKAKSASR